MTSNPPTRMSTDTDNDAARARRVQILAAEHWSLLATRGMTWNEIFSRTGTFHRVCRHRWLRSRWPRRRASVGSSRCLRSSSFPWRWVWFATFLRLVEADIEDAWLVTGMNRLRHAYIDLEPGLEQYFVASHHDDPAGILQTYSFRNSVGVTHLLSGSPVIVGTIDAVLTGVLAAIVCSALNAVVPLQVAVGCPAGFATASLLGFMGVRRIRRVSRNYRPLFPE